MRAVILNRYAEPADALSVGEMDVPALRHGQVLVKIAAAPIHPADLAFIRGFYGLSKPIPTVPGLEGAGTVVDANAGPYGRWLVGKRVACSAPEDGPGTWAEFMACSAAACIPLRRQVSTEVGATLLINPFTALSLMRLARMGRHRAFVQTAAASALGQMLARLAEARGVAAIHVVRRTEQVLQLRADGRVHVLNSGEATFEQELHELCHRLGATIAFDAVGGALSAILARAMPERSRVIVFGGLSGEEPRLGIADAIFHGKSMAGFWLPLTLKRTSRLALLRMAYLVQRNSGGAFDTRVLDRLPLQRVIDGLALLQAHATEGKVLLTP